MVNRRRQRWLRWLTAASLLFIAANVVWLLARPVPDLRFTLVNDLISFFTPLLLSLAVVGGFFLVWRSRRRHQVRLALADWGMLLIGLGVFAFAAGEGLWVYYEQVLNESPFPSWADAAYLSGYPFLLFGILLLPSRSRSIAARSQIALDGMIIVGTAAIFSWYFFIAPTITSGSSSTWETVLGLAYPLGDLVLVACLAILWIRAEDPVARRVVTLLSAGIAATVVADSLFLYQELRGGYESGNLVTDIGWLLGYVLLCLGALDWPLQPQASDTAGEEALTPPWSDSSQPRIWRSLLPYLLLPAVIAIEVWTWRSHQDNLTELGMVLGGLALVLLVIVRQLLALVENQRLQGQTQAYAQRLEQLATTDPLTELANHRAIVSFLDYEIERAQRTRRGFAVLFIDLDHFKSLNDTYGHIAGDTALREFAEAAKMVLRNVDVLGRWGGEEFLAVLPEADERIAKQIAERVRLAIASRGFSFGGAHVTCSIGVAAFPNDGEDRDTLIARADDSLYAAKRLGRNQVRAATDPVVATLATQNPSDPIEAATLVATVEALAALVEARDEGTGDHTQQVANLMLRLAVAMGMDTSEAHMVSLAGRLHDIGKVAVPDTILRKPAPLSSDEWTVIKTHPEVGSDVVSRIPTLRPLAPIVRSHHERWDGSGYPDGLAGEDIPLGARMLAVVDAYAAIITDRPYRSARSSARALAELRQGAGSQFDPAIVQMLERVLLSSATMATNRPIQEVLEEERYLG